jgi:hypothetical protein
MRGMSSSFGNTYSLVLEKYENFSFQRFQEVK